LEQDYLSLAKHVSFQGGETGAAIPSTRSSSANAIGSQVVREVVLPELEKEVNQGKNFANLRQIFNSMILAAWYKKSLKETLLNQVYSNKSKINGIDVQDKTIKEKIYQEYLRAYKKGVFNYIKQDMQADGQTIPRKYFSGGIVGNTLEAVEEQVGPGDADAVKSMGEINGDVLNKKLVSERVTVAPPPIVQPSAPISYGDDGDDSADSAMAAEPGVKLGLALLSTYVKDKESKYTTSSNLMRLDQLGKTGLNLDDQGKFREAILSAIEWAKPAELKGVVLIDRKKGIDSYEDIKLDKIRDEMAGFYFQEGILYVLKSCLMEGIKTVKKIKSTDILSAQIVMAFMKDPIDLEDEEQLLRDGQDALFREKMSKLLEKQESDNFETIRQELIDGLKQRRHKEDMVKAYEHAFDYLESRGGEIIRHDAKQNRRQLQVEKNRIMERLPGMYLKGVGGDSEERAELQRVLGSFGLGRIQLQDQNAARIDKVTFYALTGEVDTLLSYCGFQRALNIMAERINPKNTMNTDEKNLEQSPGNGKRSSMLVWGSALNPLTIAHLLIAMEEMRHTDSGYLLLTEGDFRKLALLHSAPARREMVTQLRAELFRGNSITDLRVMLEPEAKTKDEEKYHPNAEEKVLGIARLNPNSDIHYGFGADHYKAIIARGTLTEDNVRDFVYYMSMSDYIPFLEYIKGWLPGGRASYNGDIDSVIALIKEIYENNGLEGKNFDERREVLKNILLDRIKNKKEIIHVPILDSIPKLVLINKELEAEGISARVEAVLALRGGVPISYDPLRDKIIEKYGLKVTINDGITSDISSTDIRQAIVQFVLTGEVDPYKLGAVPIPEWQFLFGDEFKDYQNFLLRYEGPVLPAIPKLLEERRNAIKEQQKAPESIELQKAWNAAGLGTEYEVGLPDPPTPDRHTTFVITKKVKGAKGANKSEIRVNYSVNCSLDRLTGNDVTTFNTFSITFLSDNFSREQRENIKHLIYTQISGMNHITAGTFDVTVIANAAMAAPVRKVADHVEGGIDLNSRNLQMDINGETIDLNFDRAMVVQFQRGDFSGVMPIIIQISPIQNPLSMSVINPGKEEESLTKV